MFRLVSSNNVDSGKNNSSQRKNPIQLKLLLLGDGRVGKTSLRRRYMGQGFREEYLETLGADFTIKNVSYGNSAIRFNIWDIAGQPKFQQIRQGFYIGAQAALVLYDITSRQSFSNIKNWVKEFILNNGKGTNIPVIIIGNKIDLRGSIAETINEREGIELMKTLENEFKLNIQFLETSAKDGSNVHKAFQNITKAFLILHDML